MHRVDLHTHSQASPDGALTTADYRHALDSGQLDCIAVTDHDRIDFAVQLQAELGNRIIVGEEITTAEGEIVGLYLREAVPAGLSAAEAAKHIRKQGGLVYIPHPFETMRKGLTATSLDAIASAVDIVETYNGRTFQNKGDTAVAWATEHHVPGAASSDAHGRRGWGHTYSALSAMPTRETLVKLLGTAEYSQRGVGLLGRTYPKLNRLRRRLHA